MLYHVTILIEILQCLPISELNFKVFIVLYKTLHDQASASPTFPLACCQTGLLAISRIQTKRIPAIYLKLSVTHLPLTSVKFPKQYLKYHIITVYLLTFFFLSQHLPPPRKQYVHFYLISLFPLEVYKFHKSKGIFVLFSYHYIPLPQTLLRIYRDLVNTG